MPDKFLYLKDRKGFEECDNNEKLILFSRNDHDKMHWWTKWFDGKAKNAFSKEELAKVGEEATELTFDFLAKIPDGVPDIRRMLEEGACDRISKDEGNLFCHGQYANYWLRVIARQGDYNVYVKAFVKR